MEYLKKNSIKKCLKRFVGRLFPGLVVYDPLRCKKSDHSIALTFDDGPTPEVTPRILSCLEKAKVKATFFVTGEAVLANPELTIRIQEEGHQIGNHTYSHRRLSQLNFREIFSEIEHNNRLIKALTGKRPVLFRPPFGEFTLIIMFCVLAQRMTLVYWNFDSEDYRDTSRASIRQRLKKVSGGEIILFHSDYVHTSDVLPDVLRDLAEKGLKPLTLSEMVGS